MLKKILYFDQVMNFDRLTKEQLKQALLELRQEHHALKESYAKDIAELKQAEQNVIRERILLRTIIESIPDAIYVKDLECRKLLANQTDCENSGCEKEEEIIGKSDFDLFPSEIARKFYEDDQRVLQGESVRNREEILLKPNGDKLWLLTTKIPLYNEKGDVAGIVGIGHNITDRKQAEEALKKSEEKFRSLVTQSLEMLFLHDLNGNFLEVNKEAVLKTGYSENELLSMSVFDLHPDKSTKNQIISQWKNWSVGQSYTFEAVHQRKDGKIYPVEISTGKILVGNHELILALCRDITERKNAELELKTNESRFRSLFEQTHDAVFILDLEGRHITANQRAAEMFGYTIEEIQQLSFRETSAETESSESILKRLVKGEKVPLYERNFKKKDGSIINCEVNVELICDANGNPMHIQSVVRDITERKKAREALIKTKEMLEQTSRLALVGGWEKNLEKGEDYWTNTTKDIHEVPHDFVPNMQNAIGFYKAGESRKKIIDAVKKLIETGQPYDLELQIITAKGREKWIRTIGNAEFRDSKCVRIFGAFQDIDERKKNELALGESKEKLKELNATKDKFFSIIAHDLKSVFNGILGFTDLLASKTTQNDANKVLKFSNLLNDVANSGYSLLENLLHWARIQTGQIKFSPSLISLNDTIQCILELYKLNLKEKNISVNILISDNQMVYADASMLDAILRNLISNAIKFTNNGGSINIGASDINGEVTISVSDTGVGISDDILPKLFRIDSNITSQGTNNERGTGLGLILCKEYVEKHGGKIWIESELRVGSTFSFTLPNKSSLE